MKVWMLLFLLPLLLHAEIDWQADLRHPFDLTIKIAPQQLTVGDLLDVKAEFHYPSSYQVNVEALMDQLIWTSNSLAPQWNVVHSQISSSSPNMEGVQVQRLHMKVSPLVVGELKLSFLQVSFLPKEAGFSPMLVSTPIFSVNVLASSEQSATLPLAPLIPLEPQFPLGLTQTNRKLFIDNPKQLERTKETIQRELAKHSFPWLTLTILLACGGIGWTIYLTHESWPKHAVKQISSLASKQSIVEALKKLQNRDEGQELARADYVGLSSLLVDALEVRSGKKMRKFTTLELAHVLRKDSLLPENLVEKTLLVLKELDLIKFAGKIPSTAEAKQISQQVRELILNLLQ